MTGFSLGRLDQSTTHGYTHRKNSGISSRDIQTLAKRAHVVVRQSQFKPVQTLLGRLDAVSTLDGTIRAIQRQVVKITEQMNQARDLGSLFQVVVTQVQALLKADRVLIYQLKTKEQGVVVAESIGSVWTPTLSETLPVLCFGFSSSTYIGCRNGVLIEDGERVGLSPYQQWFFEKYQVKSSLALPIVFDQEIWGLLVVQQCKKNRRWTGTLVSMLSQVVTELVTRLQTHELRSQLQKQAELERSFLRTGQPTLAGNLTMLTPITEDEAGAVADLDNSTLRVLRKLVSQVQTTANQVGQTSKNSSSAVSELSQQAWQEVQELTQALKQVQAMVKTTQAVADSAKQVDQAVHQANQAMMQSMHLEDAAMNLTVEGIQAIQTTISATSQKIKRLGESSQKISKVVNLINHFTNQTQLLALNATLEARRAGEYGRGVAVVADEIRTLAQRSAAATTEIEKLIEEIQLETTVMATAMDTDVEQVVREVHQVSETHQSRNAMEAITGQISQLVQDITQSTQAQTQQSQSVTETMTTVLAIANQSSNKSAHIAAFFQELLATADTLQSTVGQFTAN